MRYEAGSYLRLMDSCITQLKDQEPSRTCNESKKEEEDWQVARVRGGKHTSIAPPKRLTFLEKLPSPGTCFARKAFSVSIPLSVRES